MRGRLEHEDKLPNVIRQTANRNRIEALGKLTSSSMERRRCWTSPSVRLHLMEQMVNVGQRQQKQQQQQLTEAAAAVESIRNTPHHHLEGTTRTDERLNRSAPYLNWTPTIHAQTQAQWAQGYQLKQRCGGPSFIIIRWTRSHTCFALSTINSGGHVQCREGSGVFHAKRRLNGSRYFMKFESNPIKIS